MGECIHREFHCTEEQLTLIMALEVMRNSVALSVTCLILSPMGPCMLSPSSSDKDLGPRRRPREANASTTMQFELFFCPFKQVL